MVAYVSFQTNDIHPLNFQISASTKDNFDKHKLMGDVSRNIKLHYQITEQDAIKQHLRIIGSSLSLSMFEVILVIDKQA